MDMSFHIWSMAGFFNEYELSSEESLVVWVIYIYES